MDSGVPLCSDGRRLQLHLHVVPAAYQHVFLRPALRRRLREVWGCEETQFSAKNLAPISSSDRGGNGAHRRVRPEATARKSNPSFSVVQKTSDSHRGEPEVSPVALLATYR